MKDRVAISVSLPTPATDLDKIKLPCVVVGTPGRDAVQLDKGPLVSPHQLPTTTAQHHPPFVGRHDRLHAPLCNGSQWS